MGTGMKNDILKCTLWDAYGTVDFRVRQESRAVNPEYWMKTIANQILCIINCSPRLS
jgi:hypothetical protein